MRNPTPITAQRGVLLLDAMIGILLFSLGVLAIVSLQGTAAKQVGQAKFRSDASFMADQLIGQMWANRTNIAAYAYSGTGSAPSVLSNWITEVNPRLPNATAYPPQIIVTPTVYGGPPAYTSYQVTVTLFWQMPDEFNSSPRPAPHNLSFVTTIPCC